MHRVYHALSAESITRVRKDVNPDFGSMTIWDPDAYLKYRDERTQPSYDLVARVDLKNPARIVDIGCGPGNSTKVLRERWPQARITGLDNSPEMIARARETFPQESWILADAAQWQPAEAFDLVFSNATLQWIPQHDALIARLFAMVNRQGALAVQIPANNDSPLFRSVSEVSKRDEWRDLMAGCNDRFTYRQPGFYYDLLTGLSQRLFVWRTVYYHVMPTHQALIDWYSSTGMRPYLERLASAEQKRAFQSQVLDACRAGYPQQRDGRILFPFNRLFFIAYKD